MTQSTFSANHFPFRDIRVVERKDATCLYWVVIVLLAAAILTVLFIWPWYSILWSELVMICSCMKMWLFFQKPNMAEGEATPVVEAKRLVERDDEGMSQSYHEIFDTQVERSIGFNFISSSTGLPQRRFQPLHNHKSPRRQQWKWCEWGDWDWNSSWCGCQWWPGADQKKLLEHYLSIWFIRFSSMRVQADLNVKMVAILEQQPSIC